MAGQSERPDAIIASAPACCGPRVWEDGIPNQAFFNNAVDYYHLLEGINDIPIVLAFFDQDEYEYADRGATSSDILARRSIPHLVINRPPGLIGHGASWNSAFAARFSDCIHTFLTTAGSQPCSDTGGDGADHAWMTTGRDLLTAGARPMTTRQMRALLPGRTFAGETSQGTAMTIAFFLGGNAESRREDTPDAQFTRYTLSGNRVCFSAGRTICSTVFDWPDGTLLFVGASDRITLRIRPRPAGVTPIADATPVNTAG